MLTDEAFAWVEAVWRNETSVRLHGLMMSDAQTLALVDTIPGKPAIITPIDPGDAEDIRAVAQSSKRIVNAMIVAAARSSSP